MKTYTPLSLSDDDLKKAPSEASNEESLENVEQEDEFREWLEVEILKAIQELYKRQDVPHDRIRFLANQALDLIIPGMRMEELFENAMKLDEECPEFTPLVNELIKQYEQKYNKKAIEQVTKLVASGSVDEAQEMMKKVLQFKMA